MIVRGRVVDAQGNPVAGARVFLHDYEWWAHLPAIGTRNEDLYGGWTATSGPSGEFEIIATPWRNAPLHTTALRAVHRRRVSRTIVLERRDQLQAPDLLLEDGVIGRVRVTWDDGTPAADVSLDVYLEDEAAHGPTTHIFHGDTDEQGEMSFGPVPDRAYPRICVGGTLWADRRLGDEAPLEVVLARGIEVRGQLVTAGGEPAAGYRVAPFDPECNPEELDIVITDSQGRFRVEGVATPGGAIAIYDPVLAPAMRTSRLGGPLLVRETDGDDVGVIPLPEVGTLTIRLEDARGGRPRSGFALWTRSNRWSHRSPGYDADPEGIVRIERIPLGITAGLTVRIEDSRWGALTQEFEIAAVKEETIPLRVTGAGTVVVHLHPKGAPKQALEVRGGWVVAQPAPSEGASHIALGNDLTCEMRGWTAPHLYPSLTVGARGCRERVLENVRVRDDGPTFLDVELEPR